MARRAPSTVVGHGPSQLVKCFTVGHFVMSVPNSMIEVKVCSSSIPSIADRSMPTK